VHPKDNWGLDDFIARKYNEGVGFFANVLKTILI